MSISHKKLNSKLSEYGLVPSTYYVIGDTCTYIEIASVFNSDRFLLYIPSRYTLKLPDEGKCIELEYIEVSEDGIISSDYGGDPDDFDIEKQYDSFEIDVDTKNDGSYEENLEEKYNHQLSLKDMSRDHIKKLKEIFRQLKRLKFCVQDIKYKLCISYRHYLCCIRRDNTFDGFKESKAESTSEKLKLIISIDLESLYNHLDSLVTDLATIREGVAKILDKNNNKHTKSLTKVLDFRDELLMLSQRIIDKKQLYKSSMNQLEEMLEKINKVEKINVEKIMQIEESYRIKDASNQNIHLDMEKTHAIAPHERKLDELSSIKKELLGNLELVRNKYDDLTLKVDKICFDNSVMLDSIIDNFSELADL